MDVSLTPEMQSFVQNEIKGGIYHDVSEVIQAGLRRLKQDQENRLPQLPETLEELEALLLRSVESFDRGEGVDGEEAFARLRKRAAKASVSV